MKEWKKWFILIWAKDWFSSFCVCIPLEYMHKESMLPESSLTWMRNLWTVKRGKSTIKNQVKDDLLILNLDSEDSSKWLEVVFK